MGESYVNMKDNKYWCGNCSERVNNLTLEDAKNAAISKNEKMSF